ncbi:GNAT family N-acetyltransferase [Citricoccus muralis]|uniref:GNAT family N-acetyltransferase n=1 Tax=Citricoccus muralis TaxID=169134 RepID=A0ABY8H7P4_9MICC|nr:GNAT family N-acetyltransferase [Citricoccus muralis]WFP17056.1 GNAT family N-acetyltransferase [Citricoccus muralis]
MAEAERGRRILSTDRLELREMTGEDLPALRGILQDETTMTHYEGAFSGDMVDAWLTRMLQRYRNDRFGLWAVELRATGEMIGQCGITRQPQAETTVDEVGYLFHRDHWRRGYATEAARACRDFAFNQLGVETVWAHVRDTNLASMNVAIRLGMTVRTRFVKHYRGVEMPHLGFAVDRECD